MDPQITEQPSITPIAESGTSVDVPPPSSNDDVQGQQDTTPEEITPSFQTAAQNFTDQALQFLSTASNETLGACLVGVGATTYFVLGRVGLVLIGVVGGVVLHATWEGGHGEGNAERNVEERRRKEIGVEVVKRALEWRRGKGEEEAGGEEREEKIAVVGKKLGFEGFRPETEGALNELTEAVIRDYVKYEFRMAYACCYTNSNVDGGTRLSYQVKRHSRRPLVKRSWPFSFPFPHISRGRDRPIRSSNSLQIPPLS